MVLLAIGIKVPRHIEIVDWSHRFIGLGMLFRFIEVIHDSMLNRQRGFLEMLVLTNESLNVGANGGQRLQTDGQINDEKACKLRAVPDANEHQARVVGDGVQSARRRAQKCTLFSAQQRVFLPARAQYKQGHAITIIYLVVVQIVDPGNIANGIDHAVQQAVQHL